MEKEEEVGGRDGWMMRGCVSLMRTSVSKYGSLQAFGARIFLLG